VKSAYDNPLQRRAAMIGDRLNYLTERVVGLFVLVLVLDVWLGVVARYVFHWQIPWTEELARYIMIWGILLAVPCCCYRREHIGLTLLHDRLPAGVMRAVNVLLDLLAFCFFAYVAFAGTTFAEKGLAQISTVFSMPMAVPYAAIPTAFALAAVQTLLALIRDLGGEYVNDDGLGGADA